jgi:hypothetical protein
LNQASRRSGRQQVPPLIDSQLDMSLFGSGAISLLPAHCFAGAKASPNLLI